MGAEHRDQDRRLRTWQSRTGRDFDSLAMSLAQSGIRVVAPDRPGRGRNEWLAAPLHYTDHAYAAAMGALIARLDVEQVDWIGTSLGGHIGLSLAAQDGTPIRRLVLNDFGPRISAGALQCIGAYLKKRWRFESMDQVEAHLRDVHGTFGQLSDGQWRHLAQYSAVPDETGHLRLHSL
jgi:pimeloyl-ACP methyl ester carboxylesterase